MACTPELKVIIDKDELKFTATCSGQCREGGGTCIPIIEPDISHDRRFRVRHAGSGMKEYNLHLQVEEKVENFTFHARCRCGEQIEGDATYTIVLHDPDDIEGTILNIISFGVRVLIKALVK